MTIRENISFFLRGLVVALLWVALFVGAPLVARRVKSLRATAGPVRIVLTRQ